MSSLDADDFVLKLAIMNFTKYEVDYLNRDQGKLYPANWIEVKQVEYKVPVNL